MSLITLKLSVSVGVNVALNFCFPTVSITVSGFFQAKPPESSTVERALPLVPVKPEGAVYSGSAFAISQLIVLAPSVPSDQT